jgi:beta-galactosidase
MCGWKLDLLFFVDNVRLAYKLADDFSSCSGNPRVIVSSTKTASAAVDIVLHHGVNEVARASKTVQLKPGVNDVELSFELKDPALWSPDTPNLYEMTANLKTSEGSDNWSCKTGFREIHTEGREFRLNGKKLVLNGVCRHDMWREQGFTLTRAQQDQDMRMIKLQGCNFVRLVHYPHDRRIIELADHLGFWCARNPAIGAWTSMTWSSRAWSWDTPSWK